MSNDDCGIQMKAKERYEKTKRTSKPISFNREKDAAILEIANKFVFGEWVKNLLSKFSAVDVSFAKDDVNFVPSALVEHAIENGYFDLNEYLDAKGKVIVDKAHRNPHGAFINAPIDEYNQEYHS